MNATKPATPLPLGLRQPWQWVQPTSTYDLVVRLYDAREYAVPERERENLCSVAAEALRVLLAERAELVAALRELLSVYMGDFGPNHIATRPRALLAKLEAA